MTAPLVRVPHSLANIINFCLEVARDNLAQEIELADRNARAGVLNKRTATDVARDIDTAHRLARDAFGSLANAEIGDPAIRLALTKANYEAVRLVRVLNDAHACAEKIARDSTDTQYFRRDLRRNLDSAHDRRANLVRRLATARFAVSMSANSDGITEAAGWPDRAMRVAPTAGRVLAATVRLLPVSGRARYAAEFRSELWELAQSGTGRRAQIAYATRQLRSAWNLRATLRASAQHRAAAS